MLVACVVDPLTLCLLKDVAVIVFVLLLSFVACCCLLFVVCCLLLLSLILFVVIDEFVCARVGLPSVFCFVAVAAVNLKLLFVTC